MTTNETNKKFKYQLYDPDLNMTKYSDKAYMTVEEFKIKEGYKTGVWVHHNNQFYKQTYAVSIMERHNKAGFSWRKLRETESVCFSSCPILRVDLIHVNSSQC